MIPGWMINCIGLIIGIFTISNILNIDPIYLLIAAVLTMVALIALLPTNH
jgi:predicted Co/Zn/Cd cation transporter (cation efflux family)